MAQPDEIKWYTYCITAAISFIFGVFGAGAIVQKWKDRLIRVENSVLDENKNPKVITIESCANKMSECNATRLSRRQEDKEIYIREQQNIHRAISQQSQELSDIKEALAAMPVTIVEKMRSMGVLK